MFTFLNFAFPTPSKETSINTASLGLRKKWKVCLFRVLCGSVDKIQQSAPRHPLPAKDAPCLKSLCCWWQISKKSWLPHESGEAAHRCHFVWSSRPLWEVIYLLWLSLTRISLKENEAASPGPDETRQTKRNRDSRRRGPQREFFESLRKENERSALVNSLHCYSKPYS